MSGEVISMKDFMRTKAILEDDWQEIDEELQAEHEEAYEKLMFAAGVFAELAETGEFDGEELVQAYEIIAKTMLEIVKDAEEETEND